MNDAAILRELPVGVAVKFGVRPLHARIRFLEMVLNISERIDPESDDFESARWKFYDKDYKFRSFSRHPDKAAFVKRRRKVIQENCESKMNLLVNVILTNGGNSNSGNCSRNFFNNPELASECTGIRTYFVDLIPCSGRLIPGIFWVPTFKVFVTRHMTYM
eukprot:Lithocolla_globosa_v1_NODE_5020_length_1318_cov_2.623120.p1 type:complete len:161 gc:universal NODE_5020_length_1318_cov_2.623120:1046-564(-)